MLLTLVSLTIPNQVKKYQFIEKCMKFAVTRIPKHLNLKHLETQNHPKWKKIGDIPGFDEITSKHPTTSSLDVYSL